MQRPSAKKKLLWIQVLMSENRFQDKEQHSQKTIYVKLLRNLQNNCQDLA